MSARKILLPALAVAATAAAGAVVATSTGTASAKGTTDAAAAPVYLAAGLLGKNEVPTQGGPAVGDRDGRATAVLRIQGDRLWYALRWTNVAPPTAGHIHLGAKGANGAVKVPFFAGTLPSTARAVSGSVKVGDRATLRALRTDPNGFYANLHTGQFPGGAVRGQFHKLAKPVDLNGVLNGSSRLTLKSVADGAQEVPNPEGKPTGDPDGRAFSLLRAHGSMITYAMTWSAVSPPTLGHIHKGVRGANGPVVADLFAAQGGLPAGVGGLAGMAPAQSAVVRRIMNNPGNYYTNLHTTQFSGGAVRGQLARNAAAHARAVNAPVLAGAQIYKCTRQDDGSFAYTQLGVSALLDGHIRHSFVTPAAGPPQWIAPDHTAVTGKAVTKTPNGKNIPELVLDATQSGARHGLLAHTNQVLRLNTAGGAAPAGTCTPNRVIRVPYGADYLFLG